MARGCDGGNVCDISSGVNQCRIGGSESNDGNGMVGGKVCHKKRW